jgi:hypothetical protein
MAIHYAGPAGCQAVVTALLDAGADINAVSPAEHSTPLLVAAINGRFSLARLLLGGADPSIASAAGATPLYGVINHWAPHAFYPQPSAAQETVTYLELMDLLLKKRGSERPPVEEAVVRDTTSTSRAWMPPDRPPSGAPQIQRPRRDEAPARRCGSEAAVV